MAEQPKTPYQHQTHPKVKYHRHLPPVTVASKKHEDELGDEWQDTPAAFEGDTPAAFEAPEVEIPEQE